METNSNTFNPNLKNPLIKLLIWLVITGLVIWAFLGTLFLFVIFIPLYILVAILYLILKLTITVIVNDDHYITKHNYLIKTTVRKVAFEDISHYDIETGIVLKFKKGVTGSMDNNAAVPLLINKLDTYGIPRRTVNRTERHYRQKH